MRKVLALGILILLVIAPSLQAAPDSQLEIVGSAWILAPAVSQTDAGYVGSATNISVFVTRGWGDVYVSTYSLTQEDFQGAATTATRVICNILGVKFENYNFYFKVKSDAVIIGGPSAGVAMAVAVYSALTGKPINRTIAVTGMISPDGTVGPVGGVYEKAQAMSSSGVKLFLVPPGQSVVTTYKVVVRRVGPFQVYSTQPVTLNLSDYALKNWNLRVVEISTIQDALHYFFQYETPPKTFAQPTLSTEARAKIQRVWDILESEALNEVAQAKAYINQSSLTSFTKNALFNYLNSYASSYIDTAMKSPRNIGTIPLLTSGIAVARWIRLLIDYSQGKSLDPQVSALRNAIANYTRLTENIYPRNFLELNYLVISGDLVIRASRLFNASASTWNTDPQTALQNLAYASALLDEAQLWLEGLPQGGSIDASKEASTYLSIARSTWPYVYSVLSQTGYSSQTLDLSNTYYAASASLYSSGYHLLAAIAAARSIALAEASMLDFQEKAVGSPVYVDVSSKRALEIASNYQDNLVSLYFYNQSLYSSTDTDKLTFLKLATELGSLVVDLAKGQNFTSLALQQGSSPVSTPANATASTNPSPQPASSKSLWDELRDWILNLYIRIALFLDSIARFLSNIFKK